MPVLFYGTAVMFCDGADADVKFADGDADVDCYFFVTELCATSLDKVQLGLGAVPATQLWEMLVQIAAGMQVCAITCETIRTISHTTFNVPSTCIHYMHDMFWIMFAVPAQQAYSPS